ncbi:MAG: o-succinylbenzoate synthase [Actinomycetota bacterium]|jgi:O-succinylbenzoate synthase|nr:MAG: o-succinylbenzoate synthase [Actinomycetota bacterium]
MRVLALELRLVRLPLVRPFRTSFGEMRDKTCVLVRAETSAGEGWGECVADAVPDFSGEFNEGAWLVIRDVLAPSLLAPSSLEVEELEDLLARVRGNPMAKATVVNAILDAELRGAGRSLASFLGAVRERVPCGVSVGIAPSEAALLEEVEAHVARGYRRIKLKIAPGLDVDRVRAVRQRWPEAPLSVDANAAYDPDHVDALRALDELDLLMIEQPLHHEDLVRHARLQRELRTPICLDESIRSVADAEAAIELGACRIVNVKQGRVGGLLQARRLHDVCRDAGVPVWCGGMLETGIGRATNLAVAAMPNATLPGDTSPSDRYFVEDVTPPFAMASDGTIAVPTGAGIGVEPVPERLEAVTVRREVVRRGTASGVSASGMTNG